MVTKIVASLKKQVLIKKESTNLLLAGDLLEFLILFTFLRNVKNKNKCDYVLVVGLGVQLHLVAHGLPKNLHDKLQFIEN